MTSNDQHLLQSVAGTPCRPCCPAGQHWHANRPGNPIRLSRALRRVMNTAPDPGQHLHRSSQPAFHPSEVFRHFPAYSSRIQRIHKILVNIGKHVKRRTSRIIKCSQLEIKYAVKVKATESHPAKSVNLYPMIPFSYLLIFPPTTGACFSSSCQEAWSQRLNIGQQYQSL